jgi:hypothetical protein
VKIYSLSLPSAKPSISSPPNTSKYFNYLSNTVANDVFHTKTLEKKLKKKTRDEVK